MATDKSDPPRRVRRTRAEQKAENRAALLEAARGIMVRDGYRKTMLDVVAEEAGLTKGAIYSIFGSKRELLRALLEDDTGTQGWPELSAVLDSELDMIDQAKAIAGEWARLAGLKVPKWEHAFLLEVTAMTMRDDELFDAQAATMQGHVEQFAAIFAGRATPWGGTVSDVDAERFAPAFAALLQGLAQRAFNNPEELSRRTFVDAAEALCGMVRPR